MIEKAPGRYVSKRIDFLSCRAGDAKRDKNKGQE